MTVNELIENSKNSRRKNENFPYATIRYLTHMPSTNSNTMTK